MRWAAAIVLVSLFAVQATSTNGWPIGFGRLGADKGRLVQIPREAHHDSLRGGCLAAYDPPLCDPFCDRWDNRCPDYLGCYRCCFGNYTQTPADSLIPNSICAAWWASVQVENGRTTFWSTQAAPAVVDEYLDGCRAGWFDVYGISTVTGLPLGGPYKWSWRTSAVQPDLVPNPMGQWDYSDLRDDETYAAAIAGWGSIRHEDLPASDLEVSIRAMDVRAGAALECWRTTGDLYYYRAFQIAKGANIVWNVVDKACAACVPEAEQALVYFGVAGSAHAFLTDPHVERDVEAIIDATCGLPTLDDCTLTATRRASWGQVKQMFRDR